ncbi:MAG: hypothetical protein ACK5LX_16845 [Oscillospiraceae bacterium]
MKHIGKMAALLLAVLIVATTTACGSGGDWVYEYNGERLPAGFYIAYQMQEISNFSQELSEANADNTEWVAPTTYKDTLKAELNGETGTDYVIRNAKEESRTYFAVLEECSRLGVAIDAEELQSMRSSLQENWKTSGAAYEDNGISMNSFLKLQEDVTRRDLLFTKLYDTGGEKEVSAEELEAAFIANYAKAEILPLNLVDHTHNEELTVEEQNAAIREMAADFQKRLQDGAVAGELMIEFDQKLAELEHSEMASTQEGEEAQVEDMSVLVSKEMAPYYMDNLVETIFDTPIGEAIIHEGESSIYVILRKDVMEDPTLIDSYRARILSELKGDEFEAYLAERASSMSIGENASALNRYTPGKLKEPQQG